MDRRLRELYNSVNAECAIVGACITDVGIDGNNHYRFEIRKRDGSTMKATFGYSPSDHRSRKNELTRLRRRLHEVQTSRQRQGIANEIGR